MTDNFKKALSRQEYRGKYGDSYWTAMKQRGGERKTDYIIRAAEMAQMQLKEIEELGYDTQTISESQVRVSLGEISIDIFWRNQRWEDQSDNTNGTYEIQKMRTLVTEKLGRA